MNTINIKPVVGYSTEVLTFPNNLTFTKNTVWQSFIAGMKVLMRYAGRSNADPEAIVSDNLRLLHRTLLSEPSYRSLIKSAENTLNGTEWSKSTNLITSHDLCADLITLQHNQIMKLNSLIDGFSVNLLISGALTVDTVHNQRFDFNKADSNQLWWNLIRHITSINEWYEGDIFLSHSMNNKPIFIKTDKKGAVLLSVSSPMLVFNRSA